MIDHLGEKNLFSKFLETHLLLYTKTPAILRNQKFKTKNFKKCKWIFIVLLAGKRTLHIKAIEEITDERKNTDRIDLVRLKS